MSNLYTVTSGLTPSQSEIAEAELLVLQILGARYPDLDLREGTGLRDTVVRPGAVLMALLRKGTDLYFVQNTVNGTDNNTDVEIVNSLMSNWFITRNVGSRAIINARLYFSRQKSGAVTSSVFFSPDNTLKFFPIESVTFPQESMVYDSFSNEFYIDLDLIAEAEGEDYNLGQGSLLYFSNFDPYFLRAEINYLRDSSVSSETNEEFIKRTETAISTRNLINVPSIDSNLRAQFNYLTQIQSIGMGDPEMQRDKIRVLLDDQDPRFPTDIEYVNSRIKITMPEHGYYTGQHVRLANANPPEHNGEFSITVVDENTFTYVPGVYTTIYSFPSVVAINSPVYLNYGGMVDIYCGDTRANTIVQVTTDKDGRAQLDGAIYAARRSRISGGMEEDMIPYLEPLTHQAISVNKSTKTLNVGAISHGLDVSTKVIMTGLVQTAPILSLTAVSNFVTVTLPTGYSTDVIGSTVTIEGVTPADYNGTFVITKASNSVFTYFALTAPKFAGTGSSKKVVNLNLDGTFPVDILYAENLLPGLVIDDSRIYLETGTYIITPGEDPLGEWDGGNVGYLNPSDFSFKVPGIWPLGDVDVSQVVLKYELDLDLRHKYLSVRNPVSMSCVGTSAIVTLASHGLLEDQYIQIIGSQRAEYNGVWRVASTPNLDQFTFTVPAYIPEPGLGNFQVRSVTPRQDLGFSSRGALIADFGSKYPNATVSFDIDYFQYLEGIQTYLDTPSNRILCGDLLARGFNLHILDVSLISYNGPAPSTGLVASSINTYLGTLSPGAIFVLADAIGQLKADGITSFKTPLGVTYTRYSRELFKLPSGTITDYLDPDDRTNIFLLGTVTTTSENI